MTRVIYFLFCIIILANCAKDKVPTPPEPPFMTKWNRIEGSYNVYDTLGEFLYEMQIDHFTELDSLNHERDFLNFNNVDGQFTVKEVQNPSNVIFNGYDPILEPELHIGMHMSMVDKYGKRWRLFGYHNFWKNDTIQLVFQKCNILYYLEDCTPYFCGDVHHVAVKQH